MIEIFLDENLSEYVAEALNSLNKGYFNEIKVFSTKLEFNRGIQMKN
ncbi:MAG: hypothetical protein KJ799_10450 [Bacteroidetes bacterium]|nr:hypothetical protein [Bacteroidota bacterium]MBU1678070.1 hypothetical protein [Bacteroidota bacterium]MBU2507128.1 hypothetical protein [Bacteroidota bacterium]